MGDEKAVAILLGTKDDKVHVLLGSTESFTEFDCNKIIKEKISPVINGGGGGQKTLASGTGTNKAGIDSAIEIVRDFINSIA